MAGWQTSGTEAVLCFRETEIFTGESSRQVCDSGAAFQELARKNPPDLQVFSYLIFSF